MRRNLTTYSKAVGVVVSIHGNHILALSNSTMASEARTGQSLTHFENFLTRNEAEKLDQASTLKIGKYPVVRKGEKAEKRRTHLINKLEEAGHVMTRQFPASPVAS